MNLEEKMEQDWGPVFAHESGHALMALLHGIPCYTICAEKKELMFCTSYAGSPPDQMTHKDYLVSAAGTAAERLIYPGRATKGDGKDLADFDSQNAPLWEETVTQACAILSGERSKLDNLISMLKAKVRSVGYDLDSLPEVGMNGTKMKFLILLNEQELKSVVFSPTCP
jgi:hypothetical protein